MLIKLILFSFSFSDYSSQISKYSGWIEKINFKLNDKKLSNKLQYLSENGLSILVIELDLLKLSIKLVIYLAI